MMYTYNRIAYPLEAKTYCKYWTWMDDDMAG